MATLTPTIDRTKDVVRENFRRIRLISVAGTLLSNEQQQQRVIELLRTRKRWDLPTPLVMIAVHNDKERASAEDFITGSAGELARYVVKDQKGHNETVGNAIELYRQEFDANADPFTAKRQSLYLTRRGGKGVAKFVSPFLGGQGTTCGEWTR